MGPTPFVKGYSKRLHGNVQHLSDLHHVVHVEIIRTIQDKSNLLYGIDSHFSSIGVSSAVWLSTWRNHNYQHISRSIVSSLELWAPQIVSMWGPQWGVWTLARGSAMPPMSLLLKDSVAPGVRVTYSKMGIYSFRKTMDRVEGGLKELQKKTTRQWHSKTQAKSKKRKVIK